MSQYAIKLRFTAPLHIGEVGIGVEKCIPFVHSDTLFSGICHAWALIYGKEKTKKLLEDFTKNPNKPPFRISSAFLYREHNGKTVYYLPKPCLEPPFDTDKTKDKYAEILKDMEFIPHNLFQKWIQCKASGLTKGDLMKDFGISKEKEEKELLGYDSLEELRRKDELEKYRDLYDKSVSPYLIPRNELDRATLASNIYYVGLVSFVKDAGLYFLLEIEEDKLSKFRLALSFLGERGLGGERSIGCGMFEAEVKPAEKFFFEREPLESPNAYLTLSLLNPEEDIMKDIKEHIKGYHLIRRAGFISSPFFNEVHKKKPCWMFGEGSVFKKSIFINGRLVDVAPERLKENGKPKYHQICRYGLSFMIRVKTI